MRRVVPMTSAGPHKIVDLDRNRWPATSEHVASKRGRLSINFYSILFESPKDRIGDDVLDVPGFFVDLNCDQVVDAITGGKEEYDLKPFFHASLRRIRTAALSGEHRLSRSGQQGATLSFRQTVRAF
jgi:hypothetical protein